MRESKGRETRGEECLNESNDKLSRHSTQSHTQLRLVVTTETLQHLDFKLKSIVFAEMINPFLGNKVHYSDFTHLPGMDIV